MINAFIKYTRTLQVGIILILSTFVYSAEINLDVNLIKTGQYNVSDFLDPSVSLWYVNIVGSGILEGEIVSYVVEVRLNFNAITPAIWGVTFERNLSLEDPHDELTNFDFQSGVGLLQAYAENESFISLLEENYYLPAGIVSLFVTAYKVDSDLSINILDFDVSGSVLAYDQEENIQNNVVSELDLLNPLNNSDVFDPYPWFRWESPGFLNGVSIDYTLYLYLYNPRFHSNYLDAIEDDNYLYFKSTSINQLETGVPQQIHVQYPSDDRELSCGYQYVWYVEARDIIQESPFDGESGIWGWPEPIKSPLYVFNYGSSINADNVISPSIGAEITTVRPTFYVDPIDCAESYEIWLSMAEDSDVENPIWKSDALQTNSNIYPFDGVGLSPSEWYKWKIRVNPDGEPGPWSEIFDFQVQGYSFNEPVSDEIINTVSPTFYFSGPTDIAGYELRISNSEDPTVEIGNIFNEGIYTFPFELPMDLTEGLLPGFTYYWKVIFFDGNENIVGEIEDYTSVASFSIAELEVVSPFNESNGLTLIPSFIWDSPLGVPLFELSLSTDDDPLIEDPIFTSILSGTYFQYPQFGEQPLEYGITYFWKVTPMDVNEHRGVSSENFTFTTAEDPSQIVDEGSSSKPEFTLSSASEESTRDIKVTLLAEVTGADEYIIYFSEDQEMGNLLSELNLEEGQIDIILSGEILDWGSTIFVQVIAYSEGEIIGESSSIQFFNIPEKPGSEEQVGIEVSLDIGSTQPAIEITNTVSNAYDYIVEICFDEEMSEMCYLGIIFEDAPFIYPDYETPLTFGGTYFIQVSSTDDEGVHGIPSSVSPLFIPNIVPPVLMDELYSWESTIPVASSYILQVSTTDDFMSLVLSESTEELSYFYSEDSFEPGTIYYWRVQGFDESGDVFGFASNIKYFETEGDPIEVEEISGGEVVVLQLPPLGEVLTTTRPSFQWEVIDNAEIYEIRISDNEDYSNMLWQNFNIEQNSVHYPATGAETLESEKIYYWSIRAISEDVALGEFCESFSFSISEDNTPVLTGPMNEVAGSIYPFFTWNKITLANSYGLVLGSNEDLSQIIFENHNISDKQFQYPTDSPPLEHDTSYYWKVNAYDENGTPLGDYSQISYFNTPTGIIEIEFIYEAVGE